MMTVWLIAFVVRMSWAVIITYHPCPITEHCTTQALNANNFLVAMNQLLKISSSCAALVTMWVQVHCAGKPGNVREFDSCHGNVRDFTKSQGSVGEKTLSGKSGLKLFIVNVSCIFASVWVFSTSMGNMICVTVHWTCQVPGKSGANCQGISYSLERGHPDYMHC